MKEGDVTSEPPTNDIRTKWQNQPNEPNGIPVEEIREKAQKLQRKARREVLLFYAFALLFVVFFGRSFARTHETLPRIGLSLLIAWSLYFPYQAQKRIWPRSSAAKVASTTSLDFYRRELERRRDYARHVWQWLLGPIFFSLGIFLLPAVIKAIQNPRLWLNLLPFGLLLAIWSALYCPLRKRELRKLQWEIDALDTLQK
jgi:hypothetical protein